MKIAVFTDSYRPYISGVVRSIDTFGAELLELGHEVYIFGPRYYPAHSGRTKHELMQGDASDGAVEEKGRPPAVKVFRFWSIPVPMYRGFTAPVPISGQADQLLTDLGIDIIHTHTPFAMGTLGAVLARRLKLPLVFTHHTMYHEYVHYLPGVRTVLRQMMLRYVGKYCRRADLIITPTPQIRDFAVKTYGLWHKPVKAIPTGIAMEEFRRGDGRSVRTSFAIPAHARVLVFVGRLGREKNVEFLLRAFTRISRERDDAHLILVGDGPQRGFLADQVEKARLIGRVHFTGALPKEKVIDVYHASDLFVIASTTETQGLATLEAMAAGLPVVGVDAPGTRDMVQHGVQGLLTPELDDEFAAAVLRMLSDDSFRAETGALAVTRAETFSARNMTLALVDAYNELLTPARTGRGRDQAVAIELKDAR